MFVVVADVVPAELQAAKDLLMRSSLCVLSAQTNKQLHMLRLYDRARRLDFGTSGAHVLLFFALCVGFVHVQPFESEEAQALNIAIFATMYFAALTASKDLAKERRETLRAAAKANGATEEEINNIHGWYDSYPGSPASQGKLQFHMWGQTVADQSDMWDWNGLLAEIAEYGLRNSLLLAPMPTASTSQILGNNEVRLSSLRVPRS